jgi:LuxR family maltose regulon positive regulatory protein
VTAEVNSGEGRVTRVNRLIGRPRVFRKLDRDWPAPLLVVTAPAGFGKTTTIEGFLAGRSARAVWVGLDEDDNDAVLLWSRILAEATREYGIGLKATAALRSAIGSPRRAIEQLAAEARQVGEPLIFVLDDLHLIDDAACLRSIELGVRLLAPEVSWVLLTRQEPGLPLERLHGRGQLMRLGPDELAFDHEETADLLDRFGLELGRDERDAVQEATGGWPAAVYMSALWLRDAPDPRRAALELAPTDGELNDYLVREVIGGLPPQLRTFLRRSSVLRRLNGPLCDAVLQRVGSQELIDQLRETILLVRGERSRSGWLRYHALLRRALVAELEELEPGAAAPMQRRAADWFLDGGMPEDAAELARDAGDHALLADLLADHHLTMIRAGRATTLSRWAEALPDEVLEARPDVTIAAATAAEVAARPSIEIRRLLGRADVARQRKDPTWSVENEVEFQLLSALNGEGGVTASVTAARQGTALAGSVPQLSHVGEAVLGMFLELAGEVDEAEAVSRAVIEDPGVAPRPFALLFGKGTLALTELARGRPRSARDQVERALATITRSAVEDTPIASRIYSCEALLLIAEGDVAAARRAAERALEVPFDTGPMRAWTLLVAADARARGGDFAGARAALGHADELIERSPDPGRLVIQREEVAARVAGSEADGAVLAEPISPAELRVLRLLAEDDLTRAEIADSLIVSLNTVKTHQRSLYRKLGAGDRETAIGRARSHGLLDPAGVEDDSPG